MRAIIFCQLIIATSTLVTFGLVGCQRGSHDTAESFSSKTEPATGRTQDNELKILELGEQARKNLKLIVKNVRPTDYFRTISIPGVIQDRPGVSDRGITSPAVGVVSEIHVFPGDTVRPGERLVTVKLFSEYLQATQTQLFKASQESRLVQNRIEQLGNAALSGAVAGSRLIELRNELQRQETLDLAARQELLNRGLNAEQIAGISAGNFVSAIDVFAPPPRADVVMLQGLVRPKEQSVDYDPKVDITYEVQSLATELGQTVQAGELIVSLSNHQALYTVGHAFKREAGLLEQVARTGTALQIDFAEDSAELWPPLDQQFQIRHLSNVVDSETRTLDFFVPLLNQSKTYQQNGETFVCWRFRPGQRTRILVPVEKMENVFVLPAEAVVREGPEAYVYQQNGDLFNQISVNILYEDRSQVVLANDRSITPGTYLAQNAAASLRRVLKAQSASGQQPGLHVHADGTVHAAH